MKAHVWEDLGDTSSNEHRWICRQCGAEELSFDEPWTEEGVDRVYITSLESAHGPANVSILADCDLESVRRIMNS